SEINAQRKADEELKSILDARKGNPVAAFAQGLAAGAAVPLAMNVVPMALDAQKLLDESQAKAELAALLKQQGVPKERAHLQAASAYKFLQNSGMGLDEDIEDVLRGSISGIEVDTATGKRLYKSLDDAAQSLQLPGAPPGIGAATLKKMINEGKAREIEPGPSLSRAVFPSAARSQKIMLEAQRAFEAGGEELPDAVQVLGKELFKRLKRAGPSALLLGVPAGIAAVGAQRKRQKQLHSLRQEQSRRMQGMGKMAQEGDALDVAPGAAVVPGFVAGYTSPHLFSPRGLFPMIPVGSLKTVPGRALSGVMGAATASGVAGIPGSIRGAYRAVVPENQYKAESAPVVIQKRAAARISDSLRAVYGDFP
ncbi:MAG: hypothetical protein GWN58_44460, partial [Anaerolineae bacterium]|nr:hypothetical protein [Anaerolineae bacterium]